MKSFVIFIGVVAVYFINFSLAEDPQCGSDEILDNCPNDCETDNCPTHRGPYQVCSKPDPCPQPACKCRFNSRRADNGTCIPTRDCPPFECNQSNEEFKNCPSYCPTDDCKYANSGGKCPVFGRIGIVVPCQPSCRCIENYWRNSNGECVAADQCDNCD